MPFSCVRHLWLSFPIVIVQLSSSVVVVHHRRPSLLCRCRLLSSLRCALVVVMSCRVVICWSVKLVGLGQGCSPMDDKRQICSSCKISVRGVSGGRGRKKRTIVFELSVRSQHGITWRRSSNGLRNLFHSELGNSTGSSSQFLSSPKLARSSCILYAT